MHRPPDDALDEVGVRGGPRLEDADQHAVAQNRGAIGNLHHLRNVVANEDDARALRDDLPDETEQLVDADAGQKRRRLVEHKKPPAATRRRAAEILDRAYDRKQGLFSGGQTRNGHARVEPQSVAGKSLGDGFVFPPPGYAPVGRRREVRQPHVLGQRQRRNQRQVLMDERHAQRPRRVGVNR